MLLTSVAVQVPPDRLPELYTFLGGLFVTESDSLTEWERSDTEAAKKLYESLTPIGREIYDLLLESADQGYTVDELAAKTKKSPPQVRGALSWPAKHAMSYGKVPIHLQDADGKVFVTGKVAQIFNKAIG